MLLCSPPPLELSKNQTTCFISVICPWWCGNFSAFGILPAPKHQQRRQPKPSTKFGAFHCCLRGRDPVAGRIACSSPPLWCASPDLERSTSPNFQPELGPSARSRACHPHNHLQHRIMCTSRIRCSSCCPRCQDSVAATVSRPGPRHWCGPTTPAGLSCPCPRCLCRPSAPPDASYHEPHDSCGTPTPARPCCPRPHQFCRPTAPSDVDSPRSCCGYHSSTTAAAKTSHQQHGSAASAS